MTNSVHNHHHPGSTGSLTPEERRRLDQAEIRDDESARRAPSVAWPASGSNGSASVSGGFNQHRTASRAASVTSRASSRRSGPSADPMRPLNGDESRDDLIEIAGNLQAECARLRRQLLEGTADGQGNPLNQQEQLQNRRAELDRGRFEAQMAQMDREEAGLRRQLELADFKLASDMRMHDLKMREAQDKFEFAQDQHAISKVQQMLNMRSHVDRANEQNTR